MTSVEANNRARLVSDEEIAAYRSPYLAGGYREDVLQLREAMVDPTGVSGTYDVIEHFTPADGAFHFTLLLAFVAVAELAIIFSHIDNALPEKTNEVLLTRLDLRCRKLITETRGLVVDLRATSRRAVDHGVYYHGAIDVHEGAFAGEGAFFLPSQAKVSK